MKLLKKDIIVYLSDGKELATPNVFRAVNSIQEDLISENEKQSPIGSSETINTPVPQQIHYPVQSVYTLRFGSTSMYMEWLVLR